MIRHFLSWTLLTSLSGAGIAQSPPQATPADSVVVPAPVGFVNDFAEVLTATDRTALLNVITEVRAKCRAEIAVVTLRSLKGASADEVARRIGNAWGVGSKVPATDPAFQTGVLILVAPADHQYRLELADGARFITNEEASHLLDQHMLPALRRRAYGEALRRTVQAVAERFASHFGFSLTTDARR